MFAGGGAIPLEAARLGCDTYAVELNPVAHLIELCTINFPQRYGTTLADDVEKWGRIILNEVRAQVSDLFGRFPKDKHAERGTKEISPIHLKAVRRGKPLRISLSLPTIGPEQHHVPSRLVEELSPCIGRLGYGKKNRVSSHSSPSPTEKEAHEISSRGGGFRISTRIRPFRRQRKFFDSLPVLSDDLRRRICPCLR